MLPTLTYIAPDEDDHGFSGEEGRVQVVNAACTLYLSAVQAQGGTSLIAVVLESRVVESLLTALVRCSSEGVRTALSEFLVKLCHLPGRWVSGGASNAIGARTLTRTFAPDLAKMLRWCWCQA